MLTLGLVLTGLLAARARAQFVAPSPHGDTARERIVSLAREYLSLWHSSSPEQRRAIVESIWQSAVGTEYDDEPWSAAFVTHVVNAAVPGALYRTAMHAVYTAQALRGFGRYRVVAYFLPDSLMELQPGDLVLKTRPGAPLPTAKEFDSGAYLSHADIVVSVSPSEIVTIGGNKLGGGIGVERYQLGPNGAPLPPVFAVLLLEA